MRRTYPDRTSRLSWHACSEIHVVQQQWSMTPRIVTVPEMETSSPQRYDEQSPFPNYSFVRFS